VAVETPIVLVFNEAITPQNMGTDPPSSLGTVFELQATAGAGTAPLPLPVASLLSDGHVLVLFSPVSLPVGATFDIVMKDTAKIVDRTGQAMARPANGVVGTLTTNATPADAPSVLATWPADQEDGVSTTPEIVVVFDRPVDESTVNDASFQVLVDDDDPPFDALPEPLLVGGVAQDTRVFCGAARAAACPPPWARACTSP
jgi:hypothetical protein